MLKRFVTPFSPAVFSAFSFSGPSFSGPSVFGLPVFGLPVFGLPFPIGSSPGRARNRTVGVGRAFAFVFAWGISCAGSVADLSKTSPVSSGSFFARELFGVNTASADVLDRVSEDLIVSIDEEGPRPTNIEMVVRQGVIFFYNGTKDSLLTLELDFGKYALTCFSSSTSNLAFRDAQTLASTQPIGPGGFATTCFPAVGSYRYTIYGLERFPKGLTGLIEVRY